MARVQYRTARLRFCRRIFPIRLNDRPERNPVLFDLRYALFPRMPNPVCILDYRMKNMLLWVLGVSALVFAPMVAVAETREYSLTISRQEVMITGQPLKKITLNGTIPGPVLRFKEGSDSIGVLPFNNERWGS